MFCQKCGTKVLNGAVFCGECGSKLMISDVRSTTLKRSAQTDTLEPVEPIVSEMQNTYAPTSAREVYDSLSEKASRCSKIKKITFRENKGMTILEGKIYRYFVRFSQGNHESTAIPQFPFSIPMGILAGAVADVTYTFTWNSAEGYGTDFSESYFMLGILLFLGGLLGAIISMALGNREKKEVATFIEEVLAKKTCIKGPVIYAIVYFVAAFAGATVLTIGLLQEI